MKIVGIDCASRPEKAGFAVGEPEGEKVRLLEVFQEKKATFREILEGKIFPHLSPSEPVLFAIDAPLGWPQGMVQAMGNHAPGKPLGVGKDEMFSRVSDRMIHREFRKKPLEVGADRIARAAHSALEICGILSEKAPFSMGLNPGKVSGWQTIEVYPAATFWVYAALDDNAAFSGEAAYRRRRKKSREEILAVLNGLVKGGANLPGAGDDELDAVLTVIAGRDYLFANDLILPAGDPEERAAALEGWIWTRPPAWKR